MYTTLKKIKSHNPCTDGWRRLLKSLGKTKADDEPVSLAFILQSNGLEDALWTLQCLEGADKELRLFAVEVALLWQHLMTDPRSVAALDVSWKFANGEATSEELATARSAAQATADAADAADAAWYAALAAARAAADAAWYAARATADAAWYAARATADAAWYAAWYAARATADAARATADAAWDAARAKQTEVFLKYFG